MVIGNGILKKTHIIEHEYGAGYLEPHNQRSGLALSSSTSKYPIFTTVATSTYCWKVLGYLVQLSNNRKLAKRLKPN